MSEPFLHETPVDALKAIQRRQVAISDQAFILELPRDIDDLLDHPTTHTAFNHDEYMPYWAELWPSALMLGEALKAESWPAGMVALEIGCGLGLSGMVALSLGMRVIFSDYDVTALAFAEKNAKSNGFSNFETCQMDWRHPPADLQVPLILAADVIYEVRNIEPIIHLIAKVLAPEGICWLVDPNRPYSEHFCKILKQHQLAFTTQAMTSANGEGRTVHGTLYRIIHDRYYHP